MTIGEGDKIPAVTLKFKDDEGIKDITTAELFAGKKGVLFALPGAFTPTCSAAHLPGYVIHADAILAKGVDRIVCLSGNAPHVMKAWGDAQHVEADKILMLADGGALFTEAVGLALDLSAVQMGTRSRRYAMIVEDSVVTRLAIEPPREFEISGAESILAQL